MNSHLASKMFSFFVANLRNSLLLPAWTQARSVSKDAVALRAIRALNLKILDRNLLRPE